MRKHEILREIILTELWKTINRKQTKNNLCEETISRTDEGQPRPKYIFNKCGTNIYFFTLQRFGPSPSPNFKNKTIKGCRRRTGESGELGESDKLRNPGDTEKSRKPGNLESQENQENEENREIHQNKRTGRIRRTREPRNLENQENQKIQEN